VSEPIPDNFLDLFEKRAFCSIATLLPDGSPHVTPVWVDYDGEHVIINTPIGTRKDRNMLADPRVALSIYDPDNPYRYLLVRGRVVETTTEGAAEHIDKLAFRYRGQQRYQGPNRDNRRLHLIEPHRVIARG
jgi:PPOX class probable F420-dependent enzyme